MQQIVCCFVSLSLGSDESEKANKSRIVRTLGGGGGGGSGTGIYICGYKTYFGDHNVQFFPSTHQKPNIQQSSRIRHETVIQRGV